ncbi:hypothetical protein H6F90_04815 [Trichocoleus sp. FACHB-591]|uniref:hypothetical protein n=1 Tax=Trichocoleus sp. FACHB-591 TaxID=2692872 RepID=UPI001684974C|nr:hypothetical protein [Trichocoleus sp. FACHB-591]MBD2094472.1 hypothetical protein [Trichocoleus sp. FACHB-591]
MSYEYPAIRYWQLPGAEHKSIICFAAPCDEILNWAGIPRKSEAIVEDVSSEKILELHGYQREKDDKRIDKLVDFYQSPENVIPTSVLLAARFSEQVLFESSGEVADFGGVKVQYGMLKVNKTILGKEPLGSLYKQLADLLVARHSNLSEEDISEEIVAGFKERIVTESNENKDGGDNINELEMASDVGMVDIEESDDSDSEAINPYNPDSHIMDFYKEIRLRERLCNEIEALNNGDEVLGFNRQMVLDYLAPVTVVDGQHRLLGASESLDHEAEQYLASNEVKKELQDGKTASQITEEFKRRNRRVFSATLLTDSSWSEHVFQFVVVNQKAKPISKSLLSSIIGTSLSSDEIDGIQSRLEKAGIEIDDYRVMARLIEDSSSPFKNLVKKGYYAEKKTEKIKLDWSVLNSLARDFRELKGLQPFDKREKVGEVVSYSEWKREYLLNSLLIVEYQELKGLVGFNAWADAAEGLWIDVFLLFWKVARNKLSDDNNDLAAWKDPNSSNLFNGATLRALLSDFGDFLYEKEFSPESINEFEEIVDEYMKKMKPEFFGREWKLTGKRIDRKNLMTVATYLRNHRRTGKIDGKWIIFSSSN